LECYVPDVSISTSQTYHRHRWFLDKTLLPLYLCSLFIRFVTCSALFRRYNPGGSCPSHVTLLTPLLLYFPFSCGPRVFSLSVFSSNKSAVSLLLSTLALALTTQDHHLAGITHNLFHLAVRRHICEHTDRSESEKLGKSKGLAKSSRSGDRGPVQSAKQEHGKSSG